MAPAATFLVAILVAISPVISSTMTTDEMNQYCESNWPIIMSKKHFYIQAVNSNLVLDIEKKSNPTEAKVIMAQKDGSSSQLWFHKDNAIVSVDNGLALSVDNLGQQVTNAVRVKSWDTGNDKQWFFERDGHILTSHYYQLLAREDDNSVVVTQKKEWDKQLFNRVYI